MKQTLENYQQKFIERIKISMPKEFSMVNELADLLEISIDSAYRRIRGETSFTLDEIVYICEKYGISFDSFYKNSIGVVEFNYSMLESTVESFGDHVTSIKKGIEKIFNMPDKRIIYAAEDIPVFCIFKYDLLAAFKLFYWSRSVLNIPEYDGKKFDPSLLDKDLMDDAKKINELYSRIPSTEIWSDQTFSSVLKQIEYYSEAGLFKNSSMAIELCEALQNMIIDIQKQVGSCTKTAMSGFENNLTMYYSDIEIGNNCILIDESGVKTVYMRHHTFNFMSTSHPDFCNDTEIWLNRLIQKSNLISGVAEKERYKYFRKVNARIEELKKKLS